MRRTKRKINKLRLIIISALIFIIAFIFVIVSIEKNIEPKVISICEYHCKAELSKIINSSVNEVITQNDIKYTDIAVKLINNGEITAVDIRTENVNKIRSEIAKKINEKISNEAQNEISIPIGSITDLFFLSGKGPEINIQFLPEASVATKISTNLSSSGINQTVHTIFIDITVEAVMILPMKNINITVDSNCILAESIIIGDVPEGLIGNYSKN